MRSIGSYAANRQRSDDRDNGDIGDGTGIGMRMKFDQFRFAEPALSLIVIRRKMALFAG
jgi:hypothetical protein